MTEWQIADVIRKRWCEVLRVEQADAEDRFFESGGNSLLAVRLTSALREDLDIRIPVAYLFETNTLTSYVTRVATLVNAAS
jgi:acyl carrier protein